MYPEELSAAQFSKHINSITSNRRPKTCDENKISNSNGKCNTPVKEKKTEEKKREISPTDFPSIKKIPTSSSPVNHLTSQSLSDKTQLSQPNFSINFNRTTSYKNARPTPYHRISKPNDPLSQSSATNKPSKQSTNITQLPTDQETVKKKNFHPPSAPEPQIFNENPAAHPSNAIHPNTQHHTLFIDNPYYAPQSAPIFPTNPASQLNNYCHPSNEFPHPHWSQPSNYMHQNSYASFPPNPDISQNNSSPLSFSQSSSSHVRHPPPIPSDPSSESFKY